MVSSTVRGAVDDEPEVKVQINSSPSFNKGKGDTIAILDGVNELITHVERNLVTSQSPLFDETKKITDSLAVSINNVYINLVKLQDENSKTLALLKDTRADRDKVSKLYYGLKYQLQQEVELKTSMYTYVGRLGFPTSSDGVQYNHISKGIQKEDIGDCGLDCAKYFWDDEDFVGYNTHEGTSSGICYCIFDYTLPELTGTGFNKGRSDTNVRYGEINYVDSQTHHIAYKKNVYYQKQEE